MNPIGKDFLLHAQKGSKGSKDILVITVTIKILLQILNEEMITLTIFDSSYHTVF